MTAFDPGPGWREVPEDEVRRDHLDEDYLYMQAAGQQTYWVREVPVPPLPTAPYTVIHVTWADASKSIRMLGEGGRWQPVGPDETVSADWLAASITGFEVLAEPRAVTARAVLDHIWNENGGPVNGYTDLAREYGLDS